VVLDMQRFLEFLDHPLKYNKRLGVKQCVSAADLSNTISRFVQTDVLRSRNTRYVGKMLLLFVHVLDIK